MRILGLDYGSVTVGVAVSDGLDLTAQPVETVTRTSENHLRRTLARIEELISLYEVGLIVLGLPANMDGTLGERAGHTLEFRDKLAARTGLPIVLWDERLTTVAADEILEETGVPRDERKKVIDQVAAQIILQEYMDNSKRENKDGEN